MVLALPPGVAIDRVMIQEDQTNGQCVAGYIVDAFAGGEWTVVARGVTIGNKRIEVFAAPIVASVVRLTVTDVFDTPTLSNFAAFAPQPCALPSTAVRGGMFVFVTACPKQRRASFSDVRCSVRVLRECTERWG